MILISLVAAPPALEQGRAALLAFRPQEALVHLQEAEKHSLAWADHVDLYEQLGIAHAYLDANERALSSFEMLLALDPGHALSYTLSPKVTFLFEEARRRARSVPAPAIDLHWERDAAVDEPVEVEIEVLSDPRAFFHRAVLWYRRRGEEEFRDTKIPLSPDNRLARLNLPAADPEAQGPTAFELYLALLDLAGNETLLFGAPDQPREIQLAWEPPSPWYKRWWVWALIGTAVATGVGIGVYAGLYRPPDTVDGNVGVNWR